MIKINSYHLTKQDLNYIKKFSHYVMNKFVRRYLQDKCLVKINIVSENDLEHWEDIEDLRKFKAYVYNVGFVNNKRIFNVYLNAKHYKKNAKKQKTRCKNLMLDLAHELVHVKQYLNNELFDYVAGGVRYKGTYFDASKLTSDEEYYDSPWEIEAYGREHGLVEMFNNKMEESKR